MAGIVYLRTKRYEVKLEGIAFKARDFESLCKMDFLFPEGKVWPCPPIVGLDVMRHPHNPTVILLLLCFGVGCVIIKFSSGETLPQPILNFFSDERIRFVGFGISEKEELFPFEELGLTKRKVDIGYLAAKFLNDPKFKRCELAELAQKVLRTKKMVGLTEASSFERHEQIKCAICQLFISTVIATTLLGPESKKKLADSPKKNSFLKTLNSLPLLNEGLWFKLPKGNRDNNKLSHDQTKYKKAIVGDDSVNVKCKGSGSSDDPVNVKVKVGGSGDDSGKLEAVASTKKPLKGILKCPSSGCNLSPPSTVNEQKTAGVPNLKSANSKGYNVTFK